MYGDGPAVLNRPGTHDICAHKPSPADFAPVGDNCHVNAVPKGAMSLLPWLCSLLLLSPGSPLLRAIRLELRRPSGALFFLLERTRPGGQADRSGVIHVRDPVVSSPTLAKALASKARAYRGTSSAFVSSDRTALLL